MRDPNDTSPESVPRKRTPASGAFAIVRPSVQELAALRGEDFGEAESVPPSAELLSDEVIVERAATGDLRFYEQLMRRHNPRLYRIVRGIMGDDAETEALLCETFAIALRRARSSRGGCAVSPWLRRLAVSLSLQHLRNRDSGSVPASRLGSALAAAPEPWTIDLATPRWLEAAIDDLPADQRVCYTLCGLEQMPLPDAADLLQQDPDEVGQCLLRARLRLRRALGVRFNAIEDKVFELDFGRSSRVVEAFMHRLASSR
jgi:RNA polymerase sigma-70 factor (ECF subfamily)